MLGEYPRCDAFNINNGQILHGLETKGMGGCYAHFSFVTPP